MRDRTKKLRHESLETRMLLSATIGSTGLTSNSAIVGSAAWPTATIVMTAPIAATPLLAITTTTSAPLPVIGVTASSNDGNVPQNTLDGNLSTRWSANGDGQNITYDLGTSQTVSSVKIAFHQGTSRVSKFDILTSTDGMNWTQAYTGQSSGATNSLEQFSFTEKTARYVRIVGHMNTVNTWNSLTEVSILCSSPAPLPDPTPTDAVALKVTGVTASSNDGNVPQNTLDGNLSTRWSANGDGQYITYDLGASQTVSSVKIAFHQGTTRVSKFDILTSTDGTNWTKVYTGQSCGTTNSLEQFSFNGTSARYVRIVGHMNSYNTWNSLTEVSIMGKQITPVPTPTPTPDPDPDPTPTPVPGAIDLSHWNITLPIGSSSKPTIISTPTLVNGYSSEYFYKNPDGSLVFWCPVNGVTTSGSSYPRSELRETKPDGTLYNWNVSDGTARLDATLAINQVPSTGKVVVGQIHDNGANGIKSEPLIKLVYKYNSSTGTGNLEALVRPTPESSISNNFVLATGLKLDTQFSYTIELRADLTLSVKINGVTQYSKVIDPSWRTQGMYFKAGSYCQDNVGSSTEGAKVTFYAINPTHT